MPFRSLIRVSMALGCLIGTWLVPMSEARAEDEVRANVRLLRCYDGANGTAYAGYVHFDGPEPSSIAYGMALAGRERGSQTWQGVAVETRSRSAPGTNGFDGIDPHHFRSMRLAAGGVHSEQAGSFRTDESVDCMEVGSREGVQVEVGLLCVRQPDGEGAFWTNALVVADLINHGDQFVQSAPARALLKARFRGEGEFEDVETLDFSFPGVFPNSVRMRTRGQPHPQFSEARKMRVEVEVEVPGRSQPIREVAEADCPGGN